MGGFFVGREARTLRLLLLTGVSALSFVAAQAQTLPASLINANETAITMMPVIIGSAV